MNKLLLIISTLISSLLFAENSTFYVFAKSGLNLRTQANTNATILTTIAYAEPVTLISGYEGEITIDHIKGNWIKVKYKTFTGYLVNTYLLPHKVPMGQVRSMEVYISQISSIAFQTEPISKTALEQEESSFSATKTFYKNGMEIHNFSGIEYSEYQYYLPFWSKANAFMLLKSLDDFKFLNEFGIVYPTASKVYKKGDKTIDVKVSPGNDSIEFYYMNETLTVINITTIGNQVVISVGYGA